MSKIAIIGTSGAGKTVFISTLAERYSKFTAGRPYMEYMNAETKLYTAQIWGDLVDNQRWPSSTPAGGIPVLKWVLRTPSGGAHEIHVLDTPGQDIQEIYMPKMYLDGGYASLSENQLRLKESIDEAEVLVLLVNLCDVVNAKTAQERVNLEVPIVMAAKNVLSRKARVAILFSQYDQLRHLFSEKESMAESPMDVVCEYFPDLAATIHFAGNKAYVGFVAAVAETELFTEKTIDGEVITRLRPKKGFASEGLDEVVQWMSESCSLPEGLLHTNALSNSRDSMSAGSVNPGEGNDKQNREIPNKKNAKVQSPDYGIGFLEAWKRFISRMFNFSGRATRAEFWKVVPICVPLLRVLSTFLGFYLAEFYSMLFSEKFMQEHTDIYLGGFFSVAIIIDILLSLPLLSLYFRRVHDSGASAVGVMFLFLFVLGKDVYDFCVEIGPYSEVFASIGEMLQFFMIIGGLLAVLVSIFVLISIFKDSSPGNNGYGDSEKYPKAFQK